MASKMRRKPGVNDWESSSVSIKLIGKTLHNSVKLHHYPLLSCTATGLYYPTPTTDNSVTCHLSSTNTLNTIRRAVHPFHYFLMETESTDIAG